MSYVRHESCPSCGSRDNLARYSDGSAWCFGCGHWEPPTISKFVTERDNEQVQQNALDFRRSSTRDISFPARATAWLHSYEITVDEALRAGFYWEPSRDQLCFPLRNSASEVVCIQAKNFNLQRARKAKYYNVGEKSEHFTIYGKTLGNSVVLCEDVVSSLKIGRQSPSMPLLGTHIAKPSLMALKRLYSGLIVWLDSDKWKEARDIAEAGKLIGLSTKTVLTPLDPKCYTNEEIMEYLK